MPRFRGIAAIAAACALVAGGFVGASQPAGASTNPAPWEPVATAETGTLALHGADGAQVFGGLVTDAPIAPYIVGTVLLHSGDQSSILEVCTPSPTLKPADWPCVALGSSAYPLTSGPSNIQQLSHSEPTYVGAEGDSLQSTILADYPNTSSVAGYASIYQLRLFTHDASDLPSSTYDAADIQVTPATGAFQVVYGDGVASKPGSALAVDTPGGSVQVMAPSGGVLSNVTNTDVGDLPKPLPPELTAPDGAIGYTVSGVSPSSTVSVTIHLTFHPAGYLFIDASGAFYNAGSLATITGDTVTLTIKDGGLGDDNAAANGVITDPGIPVQAPPTYVATVFTASSGSLTSGQSVTLTATVYFIGTSCPTTGTVTFFDLGDPTMTGQATTQIFTTPASAFVQGTGLFAGTVGCTVHTATTTLAVGLHLIEAEWTPSGFTTGFPGGSVLITVTAPTGCNAPGSSCTDPQPIQGNVPVGTIIISTPYTPSAPLNLGDLTLGVDPSSGVLEFSGTAPFHNISVTDTLAGGAGWTVMAQSSDLTDGTGHANGTIDSQNVGLTAVTGTPGPGFTSPVTITQNPAADPAVPPGAAAQPAGQQGLGLAPHLIASTPALGEGTYTMNGTLTINAPSSTEPNQFSGTITFTVS